MRNRAKCKLCNKIIESFLPNDYVSCECGEIAISGGESFLRSTAKDYGNFLRVKDDGSEVPVQFLDAVENKERTTHDILSSLNGIIHSMDRMPDHAMMTGITHVDFRNALITIEEILKSIIN